MGGPLDLSVLDVVGRVAGAALGGAVIGLERELDGHEAGVRTHLLLAMGAGLLGAISVGAFAPYVAPRADTNIQVDVTRVASYVAAGIGFLGAGAIAKRPDRIRGLTTAASLWVAAAVGLAAGLGFWTGAICGTALAVVALLADRPVQRAVRRLGKRPAMLTVGLAAGLDGRALADAVAAVLTVTAPARSSLRVDGPDQLGHGHLVVVKLHRATNDQVDAWVASLSALAGVVRVDSTG